MKKLSIIVAIALLVVLAGALPVAAADPAQTLHVAQWTAPVELANVTGRPAVVKVGDTYHMWYGASDTTLYHTASNDPDDFGTGTLTTFSGGTPAEVGSVAVVYEDPTYYMIAYGATNKTFASYTSTDGDAWTSHGVVFDGDAALGASTFSKIDAPFLFKDGDTYRLYFQVKALDGSSYSFYTAEAAALNAAFSLANGNAPVLTPSAPTAWDDKYVMHPWVVKDGDTYFMWYSAYGTSQIIGLAKSADGYNWVKSPANPILSRDGFSAVGEPAVINDNGTWRMWYLAAASKVNYVTATGPFEFSSIQAAVDAAAAGATINVAAGTYGGNVTIPVGKNNLTLKGANAGISAGRCAGTRGAESIIANGSLTVQADNVRIDGMGFQAPVTAETHSIVLSGADGIVITNCTFDGRKQFVRVPQNGVQMINPRSNNVTIENCSFTDGYYCAMNGYVDNLTVRDSTIENVKSGINVQGGANLVVENTSISVVAQAPESDTYCVRFASAGAGTGNGMSLLGGAYSVNRNNFAAAEGTYHSAIIVREGAIGTLQANQLSIAGDVVDLSSTELDAAYNWWGQATGPAAGQVSGDVRYSPWLGVEPALRTCHAGPALVMDAIPESVVGGQTFEASVYVVPGSYEVFGFEFALDVPDGLTLTGVEPGAFLARMEQFNPADGSGGYTWLVPDPLTNPLHVHVSLIDDAFDSVPGIMDAPAEVAKLTFTAAANGACSDAADLTPTGVIFTEKEDGREIADVVVDDDSVLVYAPVNASGTVELQGRTNWSGAAVSLTGSPFSYGGIVTGANGSWDAQVACGTYDVYVDMNAYLDAEKDALGGAASYDAGSVKLLGGNADEGTPDIIFLQDVVAIATVIGMDVDGGDSSFQDPHYPDINADGTINILDLVLAGINYTEEGPKTF